MKTKVLIILNLLFFIFSCSREEPTKPTPTPPAETDVVTPQNVRTYMVDKNATTETAALFYNLRNLGKTKTIIGQQDAFNSFYQTSGFSDMKKTTGNDPGILGSDFMFITDKDNPSNNWFVQQENKIIADTKEAYTKGIINTFSWHLREPYHENSFYTSDMTAAEKADAFKSILPGGKFHNWYKTKLDKVAQIVSQLKDSNGTLIPIIFRPFHEFDGNWFWWGASYCTPEEYISAYRFTVEYLRDTKNVHNILYAFSPDNSYGSANSYFSRYPGDQYVDILGMDNYGDFDNKGTSGANAANAKLKYLSDAAIAKHKIAALTETGYRVTSTTPAIPNWFSTYLFDAINNNNVQIAYVMFWTNTSSGYYVPTPGTSNVADFQSFALKNKIIMQHQLKNLYKFP